MTTRYAFLAAALSLCVAVPAFAQTATQNTQQNAAGAGGSAGSIGSGTPKPQASTDQTAKAKRAAIDDHNSAHAAAGSGSQE